MIQESVKNIDQTSKHQEVMDMQVLNTSTSMEILGTGLLF